MNVVSRRCGKHCNSGLKAIHLLQPYVKEGSSVFNNGRSSGVVHFGIQIAKSLGCSERLTQSSANVDLCKSVGADKAIDYQDVRCHSAAEEGWTQV